MVRVSAIVSSYNHASWVRRAVRSALAQEVTGLEVIVVDDGSSDGTRQVLESFRGDPRLRLDLRDRNYGVSTTFNRGLELARGEYVAYLGSDDYWLRGHLSGALDSLARSRAAMVYGRVRVVDAADRDITDGFRFFGSVPDSEFFPALVKRGNFVPFISAVMRREVADSVGGFDESLVTLQDYDLWVRIAGRHAVRFRDEVTGAFRWHGGNVSAPSRENVLRYHSERASVLEKARRELSEPIRRVRAEKELNRQIARAYRRMAKRLPPSAERTKFYARSLAADPYQPRVLLRHLLSRLRGTTYS